MADRNIGLPIADHKHLRPVHPDIVKYPGTGPLDLAENTDVLVFPPRQPADPPFRRIFAEDDEPFLRFAVREPICPVILRIHRDASTFYEP